jgi:exo-beta-1,3-glucanase (GH17 family)
MKRMMIYPAVILFLVLILPSCNNGVKEPVTVEDLLGNPAYPALSYGGYRESTRDFVPTVEELSEDLRILNAMGIKVLRTYNTQQFPHAERLLEAIRKMKENDPRFEMYVMLGAWIDCKDARTETPDHSKGDVEANTAEIDAAVRLANTYPDIVKIIAVGNEAMVHWQAGYFVEPGIILKWVTYLQSLKIEGKLPSGLWITSSDNFASWGGGDSSYHQPDLEKLIRAVDYISMHTYPFHDTHYNPEFWSVLPEEQDLSKLEQVQLAMQRAVDYAKMQYQAVKEYVAGLGIEKEIHIGETGWATMDSYLYGEEGSKAADEYKQKHYYDAITAWTEQEKITCFFFQAFDEPWKDGTNPVGSENHFGLLTVDGKAKLVLWDEVDAAVFNGLSRGGNPIRKSYGGDMEELMKGVLPPDPVPGE